MPSQILFILDLDRALPLDEHDTLDLDKLERDLAKLKHVLLRIIASRSHLYGINGNVKDIAHFGYHFYSSTNFFSRPVLNAENAKFYELSEESFDKLTSDLSEHYERLSEKSKTNSFGSQDFRKHLQSKTRTSEAANLRKTFEEVAVIYDWDTPQIHSPVKGKGKDTSQNLIYVITKLPNTPSELSDFFKLSSSQSENSKAPDHRDINFYLFGRSVSKKFVNLVKGEANITLNFLDTATLSESYSAESSKTVKAKWKSALNQLKNCSHIEFSLLSEKLLLPETPVMNCLTDWYVPGNLITKTLNFFDNLERMSKVKESRREKLIKRLQSHTLCPPKLLGSSKRKLSLEDNYGNERKEKIPRRFSDESVASAYSRKSGDSRVNNVIGSRASAMLKLSNQSVENLRRPIKRSSPASSNVSTETKQVKNFSQERESIRVKFEAEMEEFVKQPDTEKMTKKLLERHIACVRGMSDLHLVAWAEAVIGVLVKHQRYLESLTNQDITHRTFDFLMKNLFIVNTTLINNRPSKDGRREREFKLQVLYRFELHWLLAIQAEQKEMESGIVTHLRQISIWESSQSMINFLSDILTPVYVERQPEVLCELFDELNLEKPKELAGLFSPDKRSQLSVAPSSARSGTSDFSYSSYMNKLNGINAMEEDVLHVLNREERAKMEKLDKRMLGIDRRKSQPRQINLVSNKDKVRPLTASRIKIQRLSMRSTKKKESEKKAKPTLTAKRNLSFEIESRRSPRKKRRSPRKSLSLNKSLTLGTPQKNTAFNVLVPETPVIKVRNKLEGMTSVSETPDKDDSNTAEFPSSEANATYFIEHKVADSTELEDNLKEDCAAGSMSTSKGLLNCRSNIFATPKKNAQTNEVLFSPGRKVAFTMAPQPPTPKSNGKQEKPKSILKTPLKEQNQGKGKGKAILFNQMPKKEEPVNKKSEEEKKAVGDSKFADENAISKALIVEENKRLIVPVLFKPKQLSVFFPQEESIIVDKSKSFSNEEKAQDQPKITPLPFENIPEEVATKLEMKQPTSDTMITPKSKEIGKDMVVEPLSRPVRQRSRTERFGIDDVILGAVLSPSPRRALSSAEKLKSRKHSGDRMSEMTFMQGKSSKTLFNEEISPSPRTKRKKRLRSYPKSRKKNLLKILYRSDEDLEAIKDITRRRDNSAKSTSTSLSSSFSEEKAPDSPDQMHTWKISEHQESPQGRISIKITRKPERKKKPQQLKESNLVQRLSRSAALEMGISPRSLRRLAQATPSPSSKENDKEKFTLTPVSSLGIYDLTKSPLIHQETDERRESLLKQSRKKPKVTKRLYSDI